MESYRQASSFVGGFYERVVNPVKRCLKEISGKHTMSHWLADAGDQGENFPRETVSFGDCFVLAGVFVAQRR